MRAAEWLLERDAVHVLATDAHDTKHRPPSLSAARDKVAKLCGQKVAQALVDGQSSRHHQRQTPAVFSQSSDEER